MALRRAHRSRENNGRASAPRSAPYCRSSLRRATRRRRESPGPRTSAHASSGTSASWRWCVICSPRRAVQRADGRRSSSGTPSGSRRDGEMRRSRVKWTNLLNSVLRRHEPFSRFPSAPRSTRIVVTSPFSATRPGFAPGGLETCRARVKDTEALPEASCSRPGGGFAIALEKSAARHAASRTASPSFDGKLSCDRSTTWLPGHPAACSHQSAPSRYRKSQLNRSLSLARLPTRISTPLSLAKALYGRRGVCRRALLCRRLRREYAHVPPHRRRTRETRSTRGWRGAARRALSAAYGSTLRRADHTAFKASTSPSVGRSASELLEWSPRPRARPPSWPTSSRSSSSHEAAGPPRTRRPQAAATARRARGVLRASRT